MAGDNLRGFLTSLKGANKDTGINYDTLRQKLEEKSYEEDKAIAARSYVDKNLNGLTSGDPKMIQAALEKLPVFVFFLNALEKFPAFGQLFGLTLDVSTTGMSVATDGFQSMMAQVPGFGPAINIFVGVLVWPFLAMISLSRKEFSQSMTELLKVVPLGIGKAMSDAFMKTDRLAAKADGRWEKISSQFSQAWNRATESIKQAKTENPEFTKSVEERAAQAKAVATVATKTATSAAQDAVQRVRTSDAATKFAGDVQAQRPGDASRPVLRPRPKMDGGRLKRLSTKKHTKKNKTWRRTRRTKSARR
jgi:hypothetical protein